MRFTSILAFALPAVALAQSQAYGYSDKCPQCLSACELEITEVAAEQCYYSVFTEVNYIESICEAQDGYNCETTAVNDVCGS
ncbi:hypothetical protein M406DRAFT_321013 [Cryphonectria parasitica EP155]|uniref:Uncharacterized protein n=1 Tax=Cryphonectria parasitica (strain ATCC 38755 / EP155) TaxID=660469 RepID=A0A9P5CSN7_CRYP1|nr:uncharacterized protein M406DRAFT_321013 [Cryphonectria parasitica EP155]KAF3768812.1 hypothetical protein M406DRAFT_321013 [Cryphonectria parasitica EP155]